MIDPDPLLSEQDGSWTQCIAAVLRMAVPNAFRMVLILSNEVVNMVMLGRMTSDPSVLAAVGLGNMMQNVFGLSIGLGLISAFDTLVSQSFGAGNHMDTVVTLERGRVIVLAQLLWIAPLLCFTEDILVAIGQDPLVAAEAGGYNRAALLGLPGMFMGEAYRSFLANRSHVVAPTTITAITSLLHIVWCGYFVLWCQLGNFGAGLANAVTWNLGFLLTLAYAMYAASSEGLHPWHLVRISQQAFRGWNKFLGIGVPAMLQMCGEWWFWEICAVAVGYLGQVPLAAHVSAMSYVAVVFMPTIGISQSCATLVGQAIGSQVERAARRTLIVALALNCVVVLAISAASLGYVLSVASIYSHDPATQATIIEVLQIYFPLIYLLDTIQNIFGAALRGLGLQVVASQVYLFCFYVIMFPAGIMLAFWWDLGVTGMWWGMAVGLVPADVIFFLIIRRTDYKEQMMAAIDRAEHPASPNALIARTNSEGSRCVTSLGAPRMRAPATPTTMSRQTSAEPEIGGA